MFGILVHAVVKMKNIQQVLWMIQGLCVTKLQSHLTKLYGKINLNEKKKMICKTKHFYILLAFLLITMTLLMSVSIYCYLLKYRAKQKHLLRDKNNELKQILFKCCLIT